MIQVVKSRWMADCILFLILTQFTYSGSLIFWQFWGGDTILVVIMEKRAHFIGYLKEDGQHFIYFVSLYGPCSTWRAGRLDFRSS